MQSGIGRDLYLARYSLARLLLRHLEFAAPMRVVLWFLEDPFSDGVFVAILDDFVQRFIAANRVVMVIFLP